MAKIRLFALRAFSESWEQIRSSRLSFQDRIKVDADSESLKDSDMSSQAKKSLKSASLGVKIAVEVDMIEIESKLRAHWEQISKNQAIFTELLWLFHKT